MNSFNVHLELDLRDPEEKYSIELHDQLTSYGPSVGSSPRGYLSVRLTFPADGLLQATTTAVTVVERLSGLTAIACTAMSQEEFDAREGTVPLPDLIGVTEAAAMLGLSRARVNQMIGEGKLQSVRVGNSNALVLAQVANLVNHDWPGFAAAPGQHPDVPTDAD